MPRRSFPLWTAAFLAVPVAAGAAGFSIYENGARGLGMGGAHTAMVEDATGIFFNPAGLAALERGQLLGGASVIFAHRKFAGRNPFPGDGTVEESPHEGFTPFHAYWGHPLTGNVSLGFGVYTPFGLEVEWENPETFTGRFISTKAKITPFYFHPAAAVSLGENVRVGAGLMAVHASVDLSRNVGIPNPTGPDPDVLDLGTVELSGDNSLDFGVSGGIQVDLGEAVTVGASYRSEVAVTYEGTADFTFRGSGTALDPLLAGSFPDTQGVRTEITFPAVATVGVAVRRGKVALEADLGWTGWSSFDELALDFEDDELDTARRESWEDALFLRIGSEIALCSNTSLRLGYYFDETPQPTEAVSPILPDHSRHGISAGVGKRGNRFFADLYGLLLLVGDRSTEGRSRDGYDGTYATSVGILGLTVGMNY